MAQNKFYYRSCDVQRVDHSLQSTILVGRAAALRADLKACGRVFSPDKESSSCVVSLGGVGSVTSKPVRAVTRDFPKEPMQQNSVMRAILVLESMLQYA